MSPNPRHGLPALCGALALAGFVASCGPGPYGFAQYYIPSADEEQYNQQAREYAYGAVTANPDDFEGQLVAWFGIVEKVDPSADGRWLVRMSYHPHKERHLCADESSSSCRVTVNFKSSGGFSALLALRAEDLVPGLDKVQPGTLLRVFGKVRCRENEDEQKECDYDDKGGVLLDGVWYRQWPVRYYLTTRAAESMRR